jgi:hypothetical protein
LGIVIHTKNYYNNKLVIETESDGQQHLKNGIGFLGQLGIIMSSMEKTDREYLKRLLSEEISGMSIYSHLESLRNLEDLSKFMEQVSIEKGNELKSYYYQWLKYIANDIAKQEAIDELNHIYHKRKSILYM